MNLLLAFSLFRRLLWQLRRRITERQFLLLISVAVGVLAGGASITLKTFVFFVQDYLKNLRITETWSYGLVFLPLVGMLITVFLIKTFWENTFLKGIGAIVDAVRNRDGKLPFSQTYNHIFTSGITVGFGASAGVEAPIVATGAALGSNVADFVQLRHKDRILMLACGIAAGIAASFNAPIAGVLFAAEVFLVDISLSSIVPVMLASATGALLSKIILNESILLHFEMKGAFTSDTLPFYIILGVLTGLLSIWFTVVSKRVNALLGRFANVYVRASVAGLILAGFVLVFPSFYGEGYYSIKDLANFHMYHLFEGSILGNFAERKTWYFILAVLASALLKPIATSLTLGGGGNGGQFAPSLFIGANAGFAFAQACHKFGFLSVSISNFTIVAMAGILSGFFFAPMSAIFLIAELTHGYDLMIPLMVVSALSYSVAVRFSSAKVRKAKPKPSADKRVLEKLHILRLMESDYDPLKSSMSIHQFIPILERSVHNTFPVLGENGELLGILAFSKVKDWVFRKEYAEIMTIGQLMRPPAAIIQAEEDSMSLILEKFDSTKAFRLPVVGEGNKYLGFITKGLILSEYRKEILSDSSAS
jgi:CIC family chloride channel protein